MTTPSQVRQLSAPALPVAWYLPEISLSVARVVMSNFLFFCLF